MDFFGAGRSWGGPGDSDPLWNYIAMPFISGIVGWATNVVALKMTFYPLEFWPIKIWQPQDQPFGLIGWQGIIPAKAAKMAAKSVDLMTEKLINVPEVFSRVDPAKFAESMEQGLFIIMVQSINDVATRHLPAGVWEGLREDVRNETMLKAFDDTPLFLENFMGKMKSDIEKYFDLKTMVVEAMVANKALLNKVFMDCGEKELTFIERSGFYFGFIFGIAQGIWWYNYQQDWVLPFCGLLVGYATNWLALKIIFQPIDPIYCCGIKLHGLFIQRKTEVSIIFAKVNAEEVLYPQAMWDAILTGPRSAEFKKLMKEETHSFVDQMIGPKMKPLVQKYLGESQFIELKNSIAENIVVAMPKHIWRSYDYTKEALDMETTLREAMQKLSDLEFEGVLHPVFEEDELKLILVGAALGFAVGCFQLLVMFA